MKRLVKILAVALMTAVVFIPSVQAGNDNRRGTAGATELLINPWARSNGWGSVNIAGVRGVESFFTNVAGLAFIPKTEVAYSHTLLNGGSSGLQGSASINAIGIGQRLFDRGVIGVSVMIVGLGDILIQEEDNPDYTRGTYSPSMMNINFAYSHSFTTSIHAGVNIKVITESTSDVSGSGFGIDAGIQYVTGEDDNLKFGISLKNIGLPMSFKGNALVLSFNDESGRSISGEYISADIELPTLLNIGLAYDFLFEKWNQRLTLAGSFTSNAFLKDNFSFGCEYSLLDRVQVRAGYVYQRDIFNSDNRSTANSGFAAGASFKIPLSKSGSTNLVLDYSYRTASPLRGSHCIGASIQL